MITQEGNNTYMFYAINGNFDDAQSEVKKYLQMRKLKKTKRKIILFLPANSINIGRLYLR